MSGYEATRGSEGEFCIALFRCGSSMFWDVWRSFVYLRLVGHWEWYRLIDAAECHPQTFDKKRLLVDDIRHGCCSACDLVHWKRYNSFFFYNRLLIEMKIVANFSFGFVGTRHSRAEGLPAQRCLYCRHLQFIWLHTTTTTTTNNNR